MTAEKQIALLNIVALVTMMFSMGLQVTLTAALAAARPFSLVCKCLVANYLLVPAVALVLLYLFHTNPLISAGFFILAVCPGAPVSPPFAGIAKGNLPLAVGLMIILVALSAILSPALLTILLNTTSSQSDVHVDFAAVARGLLISQILPLVTGFACNHYAPSLCNKLKRPLDIFVRLLLTALIFAILGAQHEMLAEIHLRGWYGMGLLFVSSLAIGWFMADSNSANRRTMAVTTGPRNVPVALIIAANNFSGTPAMIAVVAYGLASIIGTLVFSLICQMTKLGRTSVAVQQ